MSVGYPYTLLRGRMRVLPTRLSVPATVSVPSCSGARRMLRPAAFGGVWGRLGATPPGLGAHIAPRHQHQHHVTNVAQGLAT
jgi:hypothetical protein